MGASVRNVDAFVVLGSSTRIHFAVGGRGRPMAAVITGGQRARSSATPTSSPSPRADPAGAEPAQRRSDAEVGAGRHLWVQAAEVKLNSRCV